MRSPALIAMAAAVSLLAQVALAAPPKGVQVVPDTANRRVDITIDGQPFTSYIWPATLKKPVLFPIVDADGVTITRGWPLEPRPGERTDHPHHDGLWFNYSNGLRMGSISGTTPKPFRLRALRRWGRLSSTESFYQKAGRHAANSSPIRLGSTEIIIPFWRKQRAIISRATGKQRGIDLIVKAGGARRCCLQ